MIYLAENNSCGDEAVEITEVKVGRAWFGECPESDLPALMGNNKGKEETVIDESVRTAHLKIPLFLWLWLQECFVGCRRKALVAVLNQPYSNLIFLAVL